MCVCFLYYMCKCTKNNSDLGVGIEKKLAIYGLYVKY